MDISYQNIPIAYPFSRLPAVTLEGRFKQFSTEQLHTHNAHQVLLFNSGLSLLVDQQEKQPLFNSMTAFIPADCPHRNIVLGREVAYKSLYMAPELFPTAPPGIRVFDLSELGLALMRRLHIPMLNTSPAGEDNSLREECLHLFLKILVEDIGKRTLVARLPVAVLKQNRVIVDYLEQHYKERLTLSDFVRILPYTARHISRQFKAEMKISIFEYLKIYRILQASIQLETTPLTVTEIAYATGYNSISCFFKDFGQIFSLTPKQFRSSK